MDLRQNAPLDVLYGFPRRRGDGPGRWRGASASAAFPPQARGWTGLRTWTIWMILVSPAGAGMDPYRRRGSQDTGRFPRRRGDGPLAATWGTIAFPFPPQARGWTETVFPQADASQVSPAGAGMDLLEAQPHNASPGFPRRRGDGPFVLVNTAPSSAFPPQARGWTLESQRVSVGTPVSPAGAGMDRGFSPDAGRSSCFPRRRGDGPFRRRFSCCPFRFPPQARGWTFLMLVASLG